MAQGQRQTTRGWQQNVWLVPIAAVMTWSVVIALPQHLRTPPAHELNGQHPGLDSGLTLAHIAFSVVAIMTVFLNSRQDEHLPRAT